MIGSREDAADYLKLRGLGITHILNVAAQVPNFHPLKFIYKKINILGWYILLLYMIKIQ